MPRRRRVRRVSGPRDYRTREEAKRVKGVYQRYRAATLRAAGMTYDAVAAKLSVSVPTARRLVKESQEWVSSMSDEVLSLVKAEPPPASELSVPYTAVQLRMRGYTWVQIAQELEGDPNTLRMQVLQELDRYQGADARDTDFVRQVELERLDHLIRGVWGRAEKGEVEAVVTVLKIMERRAKLLGLDAPQKVDIEQQIRLIALEFEVEADDLIREALEISRQQIKRGQ